MNIFVRAYGSHLMGMGHLYRISKIVSKLKNMSNVNITLFTRKYEEAINIYKNVSVDNLIEIDKNISEEKEISQLDNILNNKNYDVIINDQLNTSEEIASILKKNSKRCITFDDLGDGNYLFDFIINVLYPSNNRLKNEINSYDFMILNNYTNIKNQIKFSENVKKIFINQGAADTWGAIPDIINDLNLMKEEFTLKVLLGPSFKHFDELADVMKNSKKQLEIINYTDNIINLVKDCNLAILGAGNTLFEVASVGIPIIASTREQKELITIDRLLKDNIVYSDNKIYTDKLNLLVKDVILDLEGRKKKFLSNRNRFKYDGLDNILKLIIGDNI
jgi:spore coat polysaccharide biosynthesis predicted glycosyltransferase SpsG